MPKFYSTVVFIFGGLMMVVVGISMVQRYLPWDEQEVNEATLVPPTDLPPLDLGSQEDFNKTLDRLQSEGGFSMIQRWVESQLVPGRTLIIAGATPSQPSSRLALIDREIRPCDRDGTLMINQPATVPRKTSHLKLGSNAVTVSWTRPDAESPFTLTTWSLPAQAAP